METAVFQSCDLRDNATQLVYRPSVKPQENSPPPQIVRQDPDKADAEDTELANVFKQKMTLSSSKSLTLLTDTSTDPKVIQTMDRPLEGSGQILSGTASRQEPSQTSGAYHGTRSRTGDKPLQTDDQGATPKSAIKQFSYKNMDYFYAFVLPFDYSDSPSHRLIKLGYSYDPGQRLYQFGNAFDKQSPSDDFKCNFGIKQGDSAAETIQKARECSKFLFIVACRGSEDWKRGEDSLRGLLGQPILNDFISKFLRSVPDPDCLKKDCALTEWVTCTEGNVQKVRRAFTSNQLNSDTGGDEC